VNGTSVPRAGVDLSQRLWLPRSGRRQSPGARVVPSRV